MTRLDRLVFTRRSSKNRLGLKHAKRRAKELSASSFSEQAVRHSRSSRRQR